jgi:hypothetical protein
MKLWSQTKLYYIIAWFQSIFHLPRHAQQCSNDVVECILCYMHQINVVASFKILLVWKILKKIDCFLKGMWVKVGVFFLIYPFIVPFPNTTWMLFTIWNRSFQVYHFRALSFLTVLSKCLFILRYLCFLFKNHRCRMNTNFHDDGM